MKNLRLEIKDTVAVLTIDQPDSKVNVLNTETMKELLGVIDQLASKPKSEVSALVIASAKDGIFIAGADIKEIETIKTSEEAKEKASAGKAILKALEALDIVTVSAINGACLGGGFELALACKYRTASTSDKVKIGLPEVKLGIIPGFGGTVRLPRLIGLSKGLDLILTGKMVSSKDALKYGILDALYPETNFLSESILFARSVAGGTRKAEGKPKKKFLQFFLEDTFLGRAVLFSQAKKTVIETTKGFYPAPLKAIDLLKRTYSAGLKKAFSAESDAFGELAVTDVSKNLIKVFYLFEEYKKINWTPKEIKAVPVKKCGILGAGIMGGGIAQLVSYYDVPVRVKDVNYDALKLALKTAYMLFSNLLKKRKLKKHEFSAKFALISPTITYEGFKTADLVIEAVVENIEVKEKVFAELGRVAAPGAVLASNTSALPILKMGQASGRPDKVVGMHFFNPVHRMPLVEVIRSEKTGDEAVATVIQFARKIGKTVIVVRDVPGFLVNRILLPYLNESGFLLEEGMKMEKIDSVALAFGMPMGPVDLIDEVGIDVGYKVAHILEEAYGERMKVCSALEKVKSAGLLGKKSKKGFYSHLDAKKKIANADIYKIIGPTGQTAPDDVTALKRMIYVMINEAARCLEEKVVDRPETVDIGMITGTGFPPFRAGLLRYADSVGISSIVKDLEDFSKRFSSARFEPCNYLRDKARKGGKFYEPI